MFTVRWLGLGIKGHFHSRHILWILLCITWNDPKCWPLRFPSLWLPFFSFMSTLISAVPGTSFHDNQLQPRGETPLGPPGGDFSGALGSLYPQRRSGQHALHFPVGHLTLVFKCLAVLPFLCVDKTCWGMLDIHRSSGHQGKDVNI